MRVKNYYGQIQRERERERDTEREREIHHDVSIRDSVGIVQSHSESCAVAKWPSRRSSSRAAASCVAASRVMVISLQCIAT